MLLAVKVTAVFAHLTRPEWVTVFVLDDSVAKRNRSKKVELLALIYNHSEHKYQCGFSILTLGWTDGYSFVSVEFSMLSSANKSNRYQEMFDIDHPTNGYKVRRDSILSKPEATIKLIKEALGAGLVADYVLMDTWFTTEPMIQSILELGLDVNCMVKQFKQRYYFNGKAYTLPELQKLVNYNGVSNIFGSLLVTTKKGIPVKIVFARYILLEWIRRNENDERSYDELFHMFCDDIQNMDLTNALQSLRALFVNIATTFSAQITEMIKNKSAIGWHLKPNLFRLWLVIYAGKLSYIIIRNWWKSV